MEADDHTRVTVGVDRSPAARQAVRWAAHEARLRRLPLLIAHIEQPNHDTVELADEAPTDEDVVESCRRLAAIESGVTVRTGVIPGSSVPAELLGLSGSSELLVLGIDTGRTRASHGALGPIEDRVAVHSACPVVLVAPFTEVTERKDGLVITGWSPPTRWPRGAGRGSSGGLAVRCAIDSGQREPGRRSDRRPRPQDRHQAQDRHRAQV